MWRHLLTKFVSYKVPPVMVSTHGSVVPLAMFQFFFQFFPQSAIESIFLFYRTPVHLVDDLAVVTLIGEDTK